MASARDIIPVALAGLAGALGGRPAAGAINQAASVSRQGKLDKEMSDRREQYMQQSARQLELSEAAAKRAESQHQVTMNRQTLSLEREKEAQKKQDEAAARFKVAKDKWIAANPGALDDPVWGARFELVQDSPSDFIKFTDLYSDETGTPSYDEIRATARDLKPGESLSYRLPDGGTFTARGLMQGDGTSVSGFKVQRSFGKGQDVFRKEEQRAKMELQKHRDRMDQMRSAGQEGTREYRQMVDDNARMFEDYQDLVSNPERRWQFIEDELVGLGLSGESIMEFKKNWQAALAEEEEKKAAAANAPQPDVDAIVADVVAGDVPAQQAQAPTQSQGGELMPVLEDAWSGIKQTPRDVGQWLNRKLNPGMWGPG
jgi:hypothetical protein